MYGYANNDGLWQPRVVLINRNTGRRVELIGMVHRADDGFYDSVRDRLDKADVLDETVCYESVRRAPEDVLRSVSLRDRQSVETLRMFLDVAYRSFGFDLGYQARAIPPRTHWVNTDTSELTIASHMKRHHLWLMSKMTKLMRRVGEFDDGYGNSRDKMIDALGSSRPGGGLLFRLIAPRSIIIDYRDDVGTSGILRETSRGRDVVATWGTAHLPGISRRLSNFGYVHTDTSYHLAITRGTTPAVFTA